MSGDNGVMRRGWANLGSAVVAAPVVAIRHVRRRWWARAPFLPAFSREHLDWRKATAYGSSDHPVDGADLVDYLAWTRRYGRATR